MKILHTADLHLGRLFYSKNLIEDQKPLLENILEIVKTEKVDAVIIAGDVYDRAVPPGEAVDLLDDFLFKLINDFKVKVFIISGNHDSPERLSFVSRMLKDKGLFISAKFTDLPEEIIIEDEFGPISFFMLPYIQFPTLKTYFNKDFKTYNEAMEFLLKTINIKSNRSVLIGHCFVSGAFTSESERPFSVGGADMVDAKIFDKFSYTALGHLHRPQNPYGNVYYSGSLFPYAFSEIKNDKSVNIIDIKKDGEFHIKQKPLKPVKNLRIIEGQLMELLNQEDSENPGDYIMAILKDRGPVFDAINRLRKKYPNIMHIERPSLIVDYEKQNILKDFKTKGEDVLFSSFFEQVTDGKINDEELECFTEIINELKTQRLEN